MKQGSPCDLLFPFPDFASMWVFESRARSIAESVFRLRHEGGRGAEEVHYTSMSKSPRRRSIPPGRSLSLSPHAFISTQDGYVTRHSFEIRIRGDGRTDESRSAQESSRQLLGRPGLSSRRGTAGCSRDSLRPSPSWHSRLMPSKSQCIEGISLFELVVTTLR